MTGTNVFKDMRYSSRALGCYITMDNHLDQEVVREPFEDEESVRSSDQSPDGNRETVDSNLRGSHDRRMLEAGYPTKHDPEDQGSQTDKLYQDDSSEASSSSFTDDARFAQSFGIELKRKKKIDQSYEKLMKANEQNLQTKLKSPIIKTSVTSDCIYHKGTFYQKGDVVALCDQDDGQLYFAQLTGFLQDQYCEKSASLNWLVPIRPTSRDFFDPSAYRISLEDTRLRKLDCMTFVRHCPHDYYLKDLYQSDSSSRVDQESELLNRSRSKGDQSFIWTTMRPCRVPSISSKS